MRRKSVRQYTAATISPLALKDLQAHISSLGPGPFGNRARFSIVTDSVLEGKQQFGTYGMISGARMLLIGALVPAPWANEDFGWAMESIILKATELGIGTCWLGGTFNRATFSSYLGLQENEVLAAASPLGIAVEKIGSKQKIIRSLGGFDKRKPFGQLFFDGSADNPLNETKAGTWLECLNAVRLAPSASNKQPWRLIRDQDGQSWHFFLDESPAYNHHFAPVLLQNVELGIAMRHFQAVAGELGLSGGFRTLDSPPICGTWTYITSWQA